MQSGLTAPISLGPATSQIVLSLDTRLAVNASLGNDFTIARIRGFFQLWPTALTIDQALFGAIGICVVNGEAFDAGAASIISPWTESFDDRWMYHSYYGARFLLDEQGTDDTISSSQDVNMVIDSKAMRKVSHGDVLVAMIESANSAATATFIMNFRTGIKLA